MPQGWAGGARRGSGGGVAEERRRRAEALGALFAEDGARMVGHARHKLRDSGVPAAWLDAEDVVQAAYVKVLRVPGPIRDLRPYVYSVINQQVREALKRYRAARRCADSEDVLPELPASGASADPGNVVPVRVDLSTALTELPPQQQAAILFNKVEGYTQAESARAMRAAPGTVATHVRRALATLKMVLLVLIPFIAGLALPRMVSGVGWGERTSESLPEWALHTLPMALVAMAGLLAFYVVRRAGGNSSAVAVAAGMVGAVSVLAVRLILAPPSPPSPDSPRPTAPCAAGPAVSVTCLSR